MRQRFKLNFSGDFKDAASGMHILAKEMNFYISDDGLPVNLIQKNQNALSLTKKGGQVTLIYRDKIHLFRALGLLLEKLPAGGDFELSEPIMFDTNGAMFDVSQGNSVMNTEHVKFFLRKMAVMGLNMLMLYTEDSYDVAGQPYFGYMRGRYTQADLKELDDYAFALGIELIPCIQTLAHLMDALKWPCFDGMRDDEDTLLVGEEKIYSFIEQMIAAASAPLRSKRIHIGMDEAWRLGQGQYLLKNGYQDKSVIMLNHLNRVLEITDRLGLKPMIWSDMFFRAGSKTGDYYDPELVITPEIAQAYPKSSQLVYWDYYHFDEAFYLDWIRRHKQFGTSPVFAGGIWTWTSFSPNWAKTFATTQAALSACKKENIREVFATIWGDDSTECAIDANLLGLQLFAEHGYAETFDQQKLADRFRYTTGADLDQVLELNQFDEVPGTAAGNPLNFNASKILMWQDPLCGLFDKDIEGQPLNRHYARLATTFAGYAKNASDMAEAFDFYAKLARVLAIKAELGLQLKAAYDRGDKTELERFAQAVLPELAERVRLLKNTHRDIWMRINKPLGWETFDLRYGLLLSRIDTAIFRLNQYCGGQLDAVGELLEERLYVHGEPSLSEVNNFVKIASASRFSFYTTAVFTK